MIASTAVTDEREQKNQNDEAGQMHADNDNQKRTNI